MKHSVIAGPPPAVLDGSWMPRAVRKVN